MKQLFIEVEGGGPVPIVTMQWQRGLPYMIIVDWYKDAKGSMPMFDYNNTGTFENTHGNLKGKIIYSD